MIDMGANPHVITYNGISQYYFYSLSGLSNIPTIKSVYFQIHEFYSEMPSTWEYQTGVYNQGQFGQVKESGGEGIVIEGVLQNQIPAAFKFVEVRDQKYIEKTKDRLKDLNERLSQMQLTSSSAFLKIDGHYR